MNHFANNGKEYLRKEKKVRQYRSNQGRSPERMEKTYKAIEFVFMTGVMMGIVYLICRVFDWV
jgi:uncharacterized coiled-coil DUF342 family protein